MPQGSTATVTNSGTSRNPILNFGIPQGANATTTTTGATGNFSVTGKLSYQYTGNQINAALMSGVDICAKIDASWSFATSLGWKGATVNATDFHGQQPCTVSMFTHYPNTPGSQPQFTGKLIFANDVAIMTDIRQIQPTQSDVEFQGTHSGYYNGNSATISGGGIGPSNAYTDAPASGLTNVVWELGPVNATGGTPPQGVRIHGGVITCRQPNGTVLLGGRGVLNQHSQELSGGYDLAINDCETPFADEVDGPIWGSQNNNGWYNIHENFFDIPDARMPFASCFKMGTDSTVTTSLGGRVENIRCSCVNSNLTQCGRAGYLDLPDSNVRDIKVEGAARGFLVGSVHGVYNLTMTNILALGGSGVGGSYGPIQEAVQLSASNTLKGINLFGIRTSQGTNIIQDDQPNGCTIPVGELAVGVYSRGDSTTVLTNSPSCPSKINLAAQPVTSLHTVDYSALSSENGKVIGFNCASACTLTLPATPFSAGWGAKVINYGSSVLTVSFSGATVNGQTGRTVTIQPVGGIDIYSGTTNYYYMPGLQNPQVIPTTTVSTHNTDVTLTSADDMFVHGFNCPSNCTLTLPATMPANGWSVRAVNYGAGTLTINTNTHTLNGTTSNIILPGGNSGIWITSNGTNFYGTPGTLNQPIPAIWTEFVLSTDYTVSASTDSGKILSVACTVNCTVTLPNPLPAAGFRLRVINSQLSASTPAVVTISRNSALINGQAKDIQLGYSSTAELWPNAGGTTWRVFIAVPPLYSGPAQSGATATLTQYATKQKITLTASVTSSTIAAGVDGFCTRVYVVENATGGWTWAWPTNMKGGMAIVTTANKVNAQEFCYDATSSNWEAANAGTSY